MINSQCSVLRMRLSSDSVLLLLLYSLLFSGLQGSAKDGLRDNRCKRLLSAHCPPYGSRVGDFKAGASKLSPLSGLLSWDQLPTASPVFGSSQDILFMDAPSVRGFDGGGSSAMLPLAQPGPCQVSSSTPDGAPGRLLSSLGSAFLGSKSGCLSSSSLKGCPLCLGHHQFTTRLLFSPRASFPDVCPRALPGPPHALCF